MSLSKAQQELCNSHNYDFSGLSAVFLNCTLRAMDYVVPFGVYPDMTEHGFEPNAGGIPAQGNQRSKWDDGCRFDHPNPDYR
ncbi:hypothetical protein [Pseudidiomarina sp.]|uniref:hypothetical protein n=1 Tax=Pseudidiomarina sp. TaxID=2081707 RepID=UPI00299EAF75|nr:hypothetical protein [Pseudidiomarina sp.]MDX1706176.1 hypothetical protein [Pseudidiomarina sp.]